MWRLRWLVSKNNSVNSAEVFERRTTDSAKYEPGDLVFEMVFYLPAHAEIVVVAEFTRAETVTCQRHALNDQIVEIS